MSKKIYFVSTEVSPFVEVTTLAKFSNHIASEFHANKIDLRVFTPRYGFISERRYVIREVIRLKDMEIEFKGEDVIASGKSAFLPQTKVQVYFLDYPTYFGSKNKSLYRVPEGRYNSRNAEKYGFFSKITMKNLLELYWQPDYIFCNDWTTALIPILLKTICTDEEFFDGIKTILNITNPDEMGKFEAKHLKMLGIEESVIEGYENNLLALAAKYADEVIATSIDGRDVQKELEQNTLFMDSLKSQGKELKVFTVGEDENWSSVASEIAEHFELNE